MKPKQRAFATPRRSPRFASNSDPLVKGAEVDTWTTKGRSVRHDRPEGDGDGDGCDDTVHELKLSLEGDIYVFESVPLEKVQAVLLLLGGSEVTPEMSNFPLSSHEDEKTVDIPREAAQLKKSQKKRKASEPGNGSGHQAHDQRTWCGGCGPTHLSPPRCHHCGITADLTPIMCRRSHGPRTLCHACRIA